MITIAQCLIEGQTLLASLPNPKWEAELLLAHLLERDRSYLIAFSERTLSHSQYQQYLSLLQKRATGVPYAYLTGYREFYGLTLKVTKDTLIPRDDTEIIVDRALTLIPDEAGHTFRILDMGTGTGAIALAIASMRPNIEITALDYSDNALNVAKENAKINHCNVTFIQSDWFSALIDQSLFDLILSNPPYIDPDDHHLNGDGIRYEPISALIADDSGYADLLHLINEAPRYLKDKGYLLLEHGYNQAKRVQQYFKEAGYDEIMTHQDYGGNDRVTEGRISKP